MHLVYTIKSEGVKSLLNNMGNNDEWAIQTKETTVLWNRGVRLKKYTSGDFFVFVLHSWRGIHFYQNENICKRRFSVTSHGDVTWHHDG